MFLFTMNFEPIPIQILLQNVFFWWAHDGILNITLKQIGVVYVWKKTDKVVWIFIEKN